MGEKVEVKVEQPEVNSRNDDDAAVENDGRKGGGAASDAGNDTTEVEASMYNQNDANTEHQTSGADVAISSEKTGRQGRGGEINEDIPALHDTKTVQGEEDEVTEAGATSNMAHK
ncbi:hypothetical protein GQ600_9531 [Phytophthora cactorum]|nr:hypothetical protein GQ600_9531 [Phytophthora cactorum]